MSLTLLSTRSGPDVCLSVTKLKFYLLTAWFIFFIFRHILYEAIGHCGSSQYPVLFNPRISSNLPAITQRGDLHMCALLVDALAHGKSEIVMPKKLGKRIQNYHDYYSK